MLSFLSPLSFSASLPFPECFFFLFVWIPILPFSVVSLCVKLHPCSHGYSCEEVIASRKSTADTEGVFRAHTWWGAILFRQLLLPLLLDLIKQQSWMVKKKKRLKKGETFGEAVLVLVRTDKVTDGNGLGERLEKSSTLTKPLGLVMKPGYQDTVWWSNRHLIYHHSVFPVFVTHICLSDTQAKASRRCCDTVMVTNRLTVHHCIAFSSTFVIEKVVMIKHNCDMLQTDYFCQCLHAKSHVRFFW